MREAMQPPKVAIVGGGPGGLTAANILFANGWDFELFEADESLTSRDQGGSLDLHPDDGQAALAKAGLLDEFLAIARHEDQEQRAVDYKSGEALWTEIPDPKESNRPEIDRVVLRDLLHKPLRDSPIRWNARVDEVVPLADGRYRLRSAGVLTHPFDLVIGADGAWSKVRAVLTDVRPQYTGITFAELWMTDVDRLHPASSTLVGRGLMFALHEDKGIIGQRNGNGALRIYAAFRTSPEETDRPDKTLAGMTKVDLLKRFDDCAPVLRDLIIEADRIVAVRPIVTLPPGSRWRHRPGLTLLGDAAHVMPPLGVGVNLAMLDAAELVEGLIRSENWRDALQAYEVKMLDRAELFSREILPAFMDWFS